MLDRRCKQRGSDCLEFSWGFTLPMACASTTSQLCAMEPAVSQCGISLHFAHVVVSFFFFVTVVIALINFYTRTH
jgi:hypothetical protein